MSSANRPDYFGVVWRFKRKIYTLGNRHIVASAWMEISARDYTRREGKAIGEEAYTMFGASTNFGCCVELHRPPSFGLASKDYYLFLLSLSVRLSRLTRLSEPPKGLFDFLLSWALLSLFVRCSFIKMSLSSFVRDLTKPRSPVQLLHRFGYSTA